MLLIHAGVADHRMWEAQVRALSDPFQLIRYDARAFGRSPSQSVPFSNVPAVAALLDHLEVAQAAVVGLCAGAPFPGVAHMLTLERRALFNQLVGDVLRAAPF